MVFPDIAPPRQDPLPSYIEHVIVLMLENRSFDHMLGYLDHPDESFDGLLRDDYPEGHAPLHTTMDARYAIYPGPAHGHYGTMHQLLGHRNFPSGANSHDVTCGGFAGNYERKLPDEHKGKGYDQKVMRAFNPVMVPVLSTLAKEFAVCDRWFCSAPMGTLPNRDFLHAGTAFGRRKNSIAPRNHKKTIFYRLQQAGKSWRTYSSASGCHTWLYPQLFLGNRGNGWEHASQLIADIMNDDLPTYSFVEPDYGNFTGLGGTGNSQHPSQADSLAEFVRGEKLIGSIYDALVKEGTRKDTKRVFEKTAFIITYDEHGGFYDHVPPPAAYSPDEDYLRDDNYVFKFNLLGPRVPTVIVSPWVARHRAHHTLYDHTSVYQTLRRSFCPNRMPAGDRDGTANTFSDVFTRSSPRHVRTANAPGTSEDYPLLLERNSVATAEALQGVLAAKEDDTDKERKFAGDLRLLAHIRRPI